MGGVQHAGHMWKKDGVSSVWRKLWFEVKGTRLTYFQRDDTSSHSIMSAWSTHRSRYVRCARAGQHQQADGRRQTAPLRQRPAGQRPARQRERG